MARSVFVVGLVGVIGAGLARGTDPTAANPLFPPLFVIDPNSPQVPALSAAHVLTPFDPNVIPDPNEPGDPNFPTVVYKPRELSLTPLDWIDGLSLGHADIPPGETFAIVFSVDRRAVGAVPPEPALAAQGFIYNVQDQASKNQAAGDAYVPLSLFNRGGPTLLPRSPGGNNTLIINNGDAGGVDFTATPSKLSPSSPNPGSQTNVGGGAGSGGATMLHGGPRPATPLPRGPRDRPLPDQLFFSLQRNSPTLAAMTIPGSTGSGADIYVDFNPGAPGGEQLYAAPWQLGLQFVDDIDGFIVFDNGDFVFSPLNDQIVFTLRPSSPALGGVFAPGDLFVSVFGVFNLFAPANLFGLTRNPGFPQNSDNIDFLDIARCDDINLCIEDWAIATPPCLGDIDLDSDIDIIDVALLLASFGVCDGHPSYLEAADLDSSGCIDIVDLALQLASFGSLCEG